MNQMVSVSHISHYLLGNNILEKVLCMVMNLSINQQY